MTAPGLKTGPYLLVAPGLQTRRTFDSSGADGALLAVTTAVLPFGGGPGDSFSLLRTFSSVRINS